MIREIRQHLTVAAAVACFTFPIVAIGGAIDDWLSEKPKDYQRNINQSLLISLAVSGVMTLQLVGHDLVDTKERQRKKREKQKKRSQN